jgi:di/tricarboxylate transporter
MSDVTIVYTLIVVALVLFIWQKIPAVLVAVIVPLVLFFTGILTANQAMEGFGDPTVVFIAALFVVGGGLEAAGVTTWAGQLIVEKAGESRTRLMLLIILVTALFTATISVNGTVAALLPVLVVVAIRLGIPTSQLLLPCCFASHGSTMLTLIGAPLNVIASNTAEDAGYGPIGFFEFAVAGIPMLLGTAAIILLFGKRLLPERSGSALPADFSAHAQTLVEHYRIEDGAHRLRVRATSPYVGAPRSEVDLRDYLGVSLVGVQEGDSVRPLARPALAEGDMLLVRGDAQAVGRFATDQHLAVQPGEGNSGIAGTLFNRNSGLAEVVIPPRSKLIGQTVFPGMSARDGELMVLAVQRGGEDLGAEPTTLAAGDHLLLQGTWQALDKHLADPQVLVVDSPDLVRRQAVPLGFKAKEAIAILVVLVILLSTGRVPSAVAGVVCAAAVVLLGVLTISQAYKGIDWNTCILVGGMIPLATAMTQTGAAERIAETLVSVVGAGGPLALLAGLFMVTAALGSLISNTATALVMLPIAVAVGVEVGVSPMPLIIAVTISSHGALLTPVSTPVNLMVMGPGGYSFGDYWKFGLPILLWWLVVAVVVVPLYWRF